MIVALPTLKLALGIPIDETGEDELLKLLDAWAAAWLEKQFEQRFQQPKERVEVQRGTGGLELILRGHVADPDGTVAVRERLWVLSDPTDVTPVERRGDYLIRADGQVWHRGAEYELTYLDGYLQAPGDIQQFTVKLIGAGLVAARAGSEVQAGTGGIKSETLGDYSYTLDTATAQATQAAIEALGMAESRTLNRWRRQHI